MRRNLPRVVMRLYGIEVEIMKESEFLRYSALPPMKELRRRFNQGRTLEQSAPEFAPQGEALEDGGLRQICAVPGRKRVFLLSQKSAWPGLCKSEAGTAERSGAGEGPESDGWAGRSPVSPTAI